MPELAPISAAFDACGDDAFPLDGEAAWITGDSAARQLHIHVGRRAAGGPADHRGVTRVAA